MSTSTEIIDFIKKRTGSENITSDTDIFADGTVGDDFHELIESYAKTYSVDMTNYLWYFHADEEGGWNSIGGLFFIPPYKKVQRIPVTPALLNDIATKGRWDIKYPQHNVPKRRYDILINKILFMGVVIWLTIIAFNRC
jgi:Protein of unknown function (DUF1493)